MFGWHVFEGLPKHHNYPIYHFDISSAAACQDSNVPHVLDELCDVCDNYQ